MKGGLCVVIPTYNEAQNVPLLVPRVFEVLKRGRFRGNVLIVDDNSPDGTADAVRGLQKEFKALELMVRPRKKGLGAAYLDGFARLLDSKGCEIIVQMDADGSHDPTDIPRLVAGLGEADVVVGSRYTEGGGRAGGSLLRTLISNTANRFIGLLLDLNIVDVTSGYRAFRRKVLESVNLKAFRSRHYDFQLEMLYRAHQKGFTMTSIPIYFARRFHGRSKMTAVDIAKFFSRAIKLRIGWVD